MSKRALVVEDDANIAELLRLYLGKDGFDVMIAADGGKAESSFDLFSPDVVLLDIMLPVKDGWQICRDIRKKSSVPIIMLTAKGETADKINGLDMARTTMSQSLSTSRSCSPAYTRSCAARMRTHRSRRSSLSISL